MGHLRVLLRLCFKASLSAKPFLSENDFDLHEKKTACRTHFHMKGFAPRLALKQRHKRTRKWPIRKSVLFTVLLIFCTIHVE